MIDLYGKTAFITGGVSGIGLGIARALRDAGMNVVVTYRSDRHVAHALSVLGDGENEGVLALHLDVTDTGEFAHAARVAQKTFGALHVVCSNAGAIAFGPADAATAEDWEWMMGVNFN